MAAMQVTLENIAPSKLLNYVQKQSLVDFVSPKKYAEVEQRLKQQLDKSKVTLKDMKQHLASSLEFIQSLRSHQTGVDAFNKYQQAVQRLRGMDHGKAAAVRKVMTQPRQRYKGCLAARLQPIDYEHCLDNYVAFLGDNCCILNYDAAAHTCPFPTIFLLFSLSIIPSACLF
jgi:LPS O-antigen subunit length determinant protein (WzzB/FepE family)